MRARKLQEQLTLHEMVPQLKDDPFLPIQLDPLLTPEVPMI